jgi:ferredoxin-NADP reductase
VEVNVYSTELLDRRWLTDKVFEIELTRPESFQFSPGQRIRFTHDSGERDYSLTSTPTESTLALCVFNVDRGAFSPILASARIGSRFSFTGPNGYFTYLALSRPAVFVATGNAIAPFLSMARSGLTGFTLLHGVRTLADLYYAEFFCSTAEMYVPCLSDAPDLELKPSDSFSGRVTEYLKEQFPLGTYDFYLCGRQEMIRDVTLLVDEKFPESLIYAETFF